MNYRTLAFIFIALFVSGCVTVPQLTREQWIQNTSRTYPGKNKEEVIAAAEKLLRLADGDDFMIQHSDNGLSATRNWFAYIIIAAASGTDTWNFTVTELPDRSGVRATVYIAGQAQGISAQPVVGGRGATAVTGPVQGAGFNGTAIYDVFWARMDYLLNRTDHWMTCRESNGRVADRIVWGTNEALCNAFNISDHLPDDFAARGNKPLP